jgi:hypothetical protein
MTWVDQLSVEIFPSYPKTAMANDSRYMVLGNRFTYLSSLIPFRHGQLNAKVLLEATNTRKYGYRCPVRTARPETMTDKSTSKVFYSVLIP